MDLIGASLSKDSPLEAEFAFELEAEEITGAGHCLDFNVEHQPFRAGFIMSNRIIQLTYMRRSDNSRKMETFLWSTDILSILFLT